MIKQEHLIMHIIICMQVIKIKLSFYTLTSDLINKHNCFSSNDINNSILSAIIYSIHGKIYQLKYKYIVIPFT